MAAASANIEEGFSKFVVFKAMLEYLEIPKPVLHKYLDPISTLPQLNTAAEVPYTIATNIYRSKLGEGVDDEDPVDYGDNDEKCT